MYLGTIRYSLGTNVNRPFFQVAELKFGCVQGLNLVRRYKSGHWVPLCTQYYFVSSGQSTALFLLLSSCFKMASNRAKWSHYVHCHISGTQTVNTTLFCAGNQALVPGHRVDNPFTFLLSSEPRPCYNLGTGMICVDQKWGEIG